MKIYASLNCIYFSCEICRKSHNEVD